MRTLFCICLTVSAMVIALPASLRAQATYDGTYAGGSGTLTGSMGGRATGCAPSITLAPLTISDALLKEGFNLFEQALQEVASTASIATTASTAA